MVYCGKPSRGCQTCRDRRIKCDEEKPTCFQCQKSRRQCPGYKDDFDLVFRDVSKSTAARANRIPSSKKRSNQIARILLEQRSSEGDDAIPSLTPIRPLTAPSKSLVIPVEQRAANFFLANFCLLAHQGTAGGFMDFVVPLIKSERSNSPLSFAFNAVAMVAMGNRSEANALLPSANDQYSRALRRVNMALRDPAAQKLDATLAAVLLLGLFEVLSSDRTITAWGSHIEGAAMLIKMRGKKQLRTKVGQSIFFAVRNLMIINCLTGSKVPDLGIDWWLADKSLTEIWQRLMRLHLLVIDLRAELNRLIPILARNPGTFRKITSILYRCYELEAEYETWIANVPDKWRYRSIPHGRTSPDGDLTDSAVYPGRVDTYNDLLTGYLWNMMRIARLFVVGMIIRCAAWMCSPEDYRTTSEYAAAARCGGKMVEEMCASVPPFLGWSVERESRNATVSYSTGFACGDDNTRGAKALGGYMCILPLFMSLVSDYTSDSRRQWIMGRLKFITEDLGIHQASTFSKYQLRLPSMIVKRDAINMTYSGCPDFTRGGSITLPMALPSIPLPESGTSTALAFAHYTAYKSPITAMQLSADSNDSVKASYPVFDTSPFQPALPGNLSVHLETSQQEDWKTTVHQQNG